MKYHVGDIFEHRKTKQKFVLYDILNNIDGNFLGYRFKEKNEKFGNISHRISCHDEDIDKNFILFSSNYNYSSPINRLKLINGD